MEQHIPVQTPAVKKRLFFVDNLKIFLIILVIVHHVGQAYGPTGGFWAYKSSLNESIPALGYFFAVNAGFFMGLFFMISGYFIPGSYDKNGGGRFIKDKLIRFGIPVLFVLFVMQPLEMYFYNINYAAVKPSGFISYYFNQYLGIGKDASFGHLWFVENLLFFSLIYLVLRKILSKFKLKSELKIPKLLFLILTALFIGIVSLIVRKWYPIDKWIGILYIIQSEAAHLPQYFTLFIVGIISYRKNLFLKLDAVSGYISLSIGILMVLIVYLHSFIPSTIMNGIFNYWALYESFMAVFLSWGLVFLFREFFNKTTAFISRIAETTYAAYIFHFPIVLAVQFTLDKAYIFGAVGKFVTVSIISIILTFLISYFIRKIPFVNRIIG